MTSKQEVRNYRFEDRYTRILSVLDFLMRYPFARAYAVAPLQTLNRRSGGPLSCGLRNPERSCVEPLPFASLA